MKGTKVNVRKRSDGNGWLVDCRWGRERIRKTYPTQAKAKDQASWMRKCIVDYGHPTPGFTRDTTTVREVIDEWLEDARRRRLRPRTIQGYEDWSRQTLKHFGDDRLEDLTPDRLNRWVHAMLETYSLRYTKHIAVCIQLACRALDLDDPTRRIRWPRAQKEEVRYYTLSQVQKILKICPSSFKGVVAVQLFAGVRPEEAKRMVQADIRMDETYILVPAEKGKTGRRVIEDAPETVWAWLEKYPYRPTNYKRHLAQIHRDMGFPRIADGLRHTFCTYMVAHTDASTTMKCTGHLNSYTLHNHYVGVARKTDAAAFFNLRPGDESRTA